ncbi:hypothetical protein [Kribbella sp. NPDC051620]|uniref:hypothetical protein n=1 Tax=Kribbella sp. NPDC051620 TaxID=3364120 RepID=UPI0037A455C7
MPYSDASLLAQQLDQGRHAEALRILPEPEALVVAELLEQIANDQTEVLSGIAQQVIVRIYDRLEASSLTEEPPMAPTAQGTAHLSKALGTFAALFGPARRSAPDSKS